MTFVHLQARDPGRSPAFDRRAAVRMDAGAALAAGEGAKADGGGA